MKRKTAMLLAGVMLVSALSGCGGAAGNNSSSTDGTMKTSADYVTETADEQGDVQAAPSDNGNEEAYEVVMQWPTVTETPAGITDVENAINEIIEPEIGVTLKLEPVNVANLANETSLAISSGSKLDICLTLFTGVGSLVRTGSVIPIDELYETYGADIAEACGVSIFGGYYGNAMYAVPIAYVNGKSYGYAARTDLLTKYGFEIDEEKIYTIEELEEIFAAVKEGEGDAFYCIAGYVNQESMGSVENIYAYDKLGATAASGVLMLTEEDPEMKVTNLFETKEYEDYAGRMYRWAQAGYYSPDASSATESWMDQVKAGNYLGGFTYTSGAVKGDFESNTGMEITIINTVEGYSASHMFQDTLWSITSACQNPEKTMEFLNYIYKDSRISTLLQFGIEGVSYEVTEQDENGTVIKFPEGQNPMTVSFYCLLGVYGNRLEWPVMAPETTTTNKEIKEWSESVMHISPALGYCFVSDSVASEYAAVTSVMNQYMPIISAGAIDPVQELPEFIEALKAAGIDTVIEENQRQLDEWLTENGN